MRKILIILLLYNLNYFAQTKSNLPFIGKRNFNFPLGSCCEESITIDKNGNCTIRAYEAPEIGDNVIIIYNGKFNKVIWIKENGKKIYGYLIEKKHITRLNKNGTPEIGCREEKEICKSELYK